MDKLIGERHGAGSFIALGGGESRRVSESADAEPVLPDHAQTQGDEDDPTQGMSLGWAIALMVAVFSVIHYSGGG